MLGAREVLDEKLTSEKTIKRQEEPVRKRSEESVSPVGRKCKTLKREGAR